MLVCIHPCKYFMLSLIEGCRSDVLMFYILLITVVYIYRQSFCMILQMMIIVYAPWRFAEESGHVVQWGRHGSFLSCAKDLQTAGLPLSPNTAIPGSRISASHRCHRRCLVVEGHFMSCHVISQITVQKHIKTESKGGLAALEDKGTMKRWRRAFCRNVKNVWGMCMCLYVELAELACLDVYRYVCGFVMLCDFVPLFQNLLQEADTVLLGRLNQQSFNLYHIAILCIAAD